MPEPEARTWPLSARTDILPTARPLAFAQEHGRVVDTIYVCNSAENLSGQRACTGPVHLSRPGTLMPLTPYMM
jgi:hypothetical protein